MKGNQCFEVTCITCPIGCRVSVVAADGEYRFSGNQCKRGAEFAIAELTAPLRTLTTTVRTVFPNMPVVPVRTRGEVPKEKIPEIIRELSKITIAKNMGIGDTVAADITGTKIDVITTNAVCSEQ